MCWNFSDRENPRSGFFWYFEIIFKPLLESEYFLEFFVSLKYEIKVAGTSKLNRLPTTRRIMIEAVW